MFFIFAAFREINLSVIGPYIDYLIEKQNVKSVFSKSNLFISSKVLGNKAACFSHCYYLESKLICYLNFLVVNGTTGEGCSLTVDERKQLAAAWCQHGKDK